MQLHNRLATVAPDGQPDVVPVGFEFDGTSFYIGGMNRVDDGKAGDPGVDEQFEGVLDGRPFADAEELGRHDILGESVHLGQCKAGSG